jgi:hypothetical protein
MWGLLNMADEDDSIVFVHESVPSETVSIAKIYESTTAFFQNSKIKFNKTIPLRQYISLQAIHTRSQLKN